MAHLGGSSPSHARIQYGAVTSCRLTKRQVAQTGSSQRFTAHDAGVCIASMSLTLIRTTRAIWPRVGFGSAGISIHPTLVASKGRSIS
jgi:hypothetical protein